MVLIIFNLSYVTSLFMQEELKQRLLREGHRLTQPRRIILMLLRSTSCHPDANWVYDQARKQIPHLSLGTVYRTLNILCEAGLVREIHCGEAHTRYDGNTEVHYHVVCRRCGVIGDIPKLPLQQLKAQASKQTNFRIEGCSVEFAGLCPNCQKEEIA